MFYGIFNVVKRPGDDVRTRSLRRNKSRNKVSVGEPAEGSLKSGVYSKKK